MVVCCSSSCAALFDFPSSCGVIWFILKIDYSIKDLGVNVADPVTLILSYIFVCIMSLYAINLDVVGLFADSSFTFLDLNRAVKMFKTP